MLVAPNGMVLEATTGANTTGGFGIKAREDTVVAAWTDEDGVNLVARFGLASKTIKVTDPALMVPGGRRSGSITLTSGSIWILL